MTPGETLDAAANQINTLAEAATDGPWVYTSRNYIETGAVKVDEADWGPEGHSGIKISTHQDDHAYRYGDAQYIAAMNPLVGNALADWLRSEAQAFRDGEGGGFDGADLYRVNPCALALARLINGGAS